MGVGFALCDTHDGLDIQQSVIEPVKVLSHHRIAMSGGAAFIAKALNISYTNKYLVIADYADYRDGKWIANAVYSYDDMIFGTVRFEVESRK